MGGVAYGVVCLVWPLPGVERGAKFEQLVPVDIGAVVEGIYIEQGGRVGDGSGPFAVDGEAKQADVSGASV